MRCSKVKKLFSLYHDGALNDAVLSQVKAHLDSCDMCKAHYARYSVSADKLSASLNLIADEAPEYHGLEQRLAAVIRAESSRDASQTLIMRCISNLQPVPAFCTMLAILVLGLMLLFSGLMSDPTSNTPQVVSGKRTVFTVRPDNDGRLDTGYTSKRYARIEDSEVRHQR
jgi:anti-sigma factor RsiW